MIKAYRKINAKDPELTRVQDNIDQTLKPVLSTEILNGRLIKSIALLTGQDNLIEHKLGRELIGYLVTRQDANSIIYENKGTTEVLKRFLTLNATANVTVDVWVF